MSFARALAWRNLGRPRLYSTTTFSPKPRAKTTSNSFLRISEEIQEALHANRPVVALETTIYTHGFPYPENVALASHLESVVRVNGGVPATIGIINGVARVGLSPEELIQLAASAGKQDTLKISRRDLAYACGTRLAGKTFHGGTTIAGTMILAHLAGIKVFATGGLGGVHRGAESSMDISADLTELGRTPVTVVSSGCKSFLDIARTMEYLETEGVLVGTFADGREGKVDFPAFWSRDSGIKSPLTIENEMEAAAIIHAQHSLPVHPGILFANPIPEAAEIPKPEMETYIEEAIRQANASGASGKDNTPFILNKIKELSQGKSIPANRALIENNVKRGTLIARELAVLEGQQGNAESGSGFTPYMPPVEKIATPEPSPEVEDVKPVDRADPAIVVAGALAIDFSCDYAPFSGTTGDATRTPQLHTSNPSKISQSLGGVAHNIAKAAHLVGPPVQLVSVVGDDLSGRAAISQLQAEGLRTDGIQVVPNARTSQYVAVNDSNKDLHLAMADMSTLEALPSSAIEELITSHLSRKPRHLILDTNWSAPALQSWLSLARQKSPNTHITVEPVSTAKSTRLFPHGGPPRPVHPSPALDLITPNVHELAALHHAAAEHGYLHTPEHFRVIDALGIPSTGLRVPLAATVGSHLVDQGLPQRAIQLLPFVPTVLTKMGPDGVLLVQILRRGDKRLSGPEHSSYVLARNENGDEEVDVGGLYVRAFPPEEVVKGHEVISVNGVGDTFAGVLVSALAKGWEWEDAIKVAQRAAGRTVRSRESVGDVVGLLD